MPPLAPNESGKVRICSGGMELLLIHSLDTGHCRLNEVGGKKKYNGTGGVGEVIYRGSHQQHKAGKVVALGHMTGS